MPVAYTSSRGRQRGSVRKQTTVRHGLVCTSHKGTNAVCEVRTRAMTEMARFRALADENRWKLLVGDEVGRKSVLRNLKV